MTEFQSFQTDAERSAWIQAHAEYYTVVLSRPLRREQIAASMPRYARAECPSLEIAREVARRFLEVEPGARLLIYAVSGVQSCYVETIKRSEHEYAKPEPTQSPSPDQ